MQESTAELIGNRYELIHLLGRGAMGEVYKALDRLTSQSVALKRVTALTEQTGIDPDATLEYRLALAREFKLLANLRHPYIINVMDYGFDSNQQPYVIMEFLPEAADFLVGASDSSLTRKADFLVQLLQGLAYLHRRGILHRDLKPANVLISGGSQLKVLDFGLAARPEEVQDEESVAGTLNYIAPEVFMGGEISAAGDLYAVGVMAYELLAGQHPFASFQQTINALIQAVMFEAPDLAPLEDLDLDEDTPTLPGGILPDFSEDETKFRLTELPIQPDSDPASVSDQPTNFYGYGSSVASVIGRLLAKDPDDRYREAYDVIDDLAAAFRKEIPRESSAILDSFLQSAEFVGRKREIEMFTQIIEQVESGERSGGVWLIGGESGVGKSRFLDKLRSIALVQGITVLRGQAVAEGGVPYQLWREPVRRLVLATTVSDIDASILKDIVPDIGQLLKRPVADAPEVEDTEYQQRLIEAIISLFQRVRVPVLLLLEDLQWSSKSLDVLRGLQRLTNTQPLIILGSFRTDDKPDLPDALPGMELVRLERLSAQEIAELSASMLGKAGARSEVQSLLQKETEGNALFLVEVVRALVQDAGRLSDVGRITLPQQVFVGGIQAVIGRRLDDLAEGELRLLQMAAVAGREIDLQLLRTIAENNFYPGIEQVNIDDWLTITLNKGILEIQDDIWRFSHDKMRQTTLSRLTENERIRMHHAIAEGIEFLYAGVNEYFPVLVNHWHEAEAVDKELLYCRLAGRYALQTSASAEAITYNKQALELLTRFTPLLDDPLRMKANLYIGLGDALENQGAYDEANDYLNQALELCTAIRYHIGLVNTLNTLADVAWRQGEYIQAVDYCEAALDIAREHEDKRGIARALNRIGVIRISQGDYPAAQASLEPSLELEREINNRPGMASVVNNLGYIAFAQGNYTAAEGYFSEALQLAQESGERRRAATASLNLGAIVGEQGDYDSALKHFQETKAICEEIGNQRGVGLALRNMGGVAELLKDFDKAEAYYRSSWEIMLSLGLRQESAATLTKLAHIARLQNHHEEAFTLYQEAMQTAHEIEALPIVLENIVGIAAITTDKRRALALLGFALNHPSLFDNIRSEAEPIVEAMKSTLPEDHAEAAFNHGKATFELETVISQLLNAKFSDI